MHAPAEPTRRLYHAVIVTAVVVIGLIMHRVDFGLNAVVRDMLGDALWAMMIFHVLRVVCPRARWWIPTLAALAICFSVETSQRFHAPWLDAFRATLPGHLILGNSFDPRDFLSYTLGVTAAACVDRVISARRV